MRLRTSMNGLLAITGVVCGAILVTGCSSQVPETSGTAPEPGRLALGLTNQMIPGYSHQLSRSRFAMGASVRAVVDGARSRMIGTEGTFTVNMTTGAAVAILNSDSTLLPRTTTARSGDQHNQLARDYFVQLGIPGDQLGPAVANSIHLGSGPTDSAALPVSSCIGYDSVIRRVVSGFEVADSKAVVQFNNSGEVVFEYVHWPALPTSVLADARSLASALVDPVQGTVLRGKLPASSGTVSVVIRHTGGFDSTPVAASAMFVVFDGTRARHFDINGTPVAPPGDVAITPGDPR
jgi:hypothetical protein